MPDSDDYFHKDAAQLCMPDIPDDINAESDSIDLDDVPCIVEALPSLSASSAPATSAAMSASVSTSAATTTRAAAGSEAPREIADARRPQPSVMTPVHISRSAYPTSGYHY